MKKIVVLLLALLSVWSVQAQKSTSTPIPPAPTPTVAEEVAEEPSLLLTGVFEGLQTSRTEDGGFVVGDPDAPLTIVEFADWACPHCQTYREVIEPTLMNYLWEGQVKYEFRPFPTAGGEATIFAAQVAECADLLSEGGFWQSYEILYRVALSRNYTREGIANTIADDLDLDLDELLECTDDARQIISDYELAIASGVQGTPMVMVRYGDDEPELMEVDGVVYNRGGVPADILIEVIEAAQDSDAEAAEVAK
jgi:protein-disulfide isomerase